MAHEHLLKMLVDGLENMARDFEIFGKLLNQRAEVHGFPHLFKPTDYHPPKPFLKPPNYPSKEESLTRAAESALKVAENYALVVAYFHLAPNPPEPLNPEQIGEEGLLHLITSWQELGAGVFKTILKLYGERPVSPPPSPEPGASSELRLWAEAAAWLEKIAADSTLFTASQELSKTSKSRPKKNPSVPVLDSLARLEQALHWTTADSLLVANALPYHLYRAAHTTYETGPKKTVAQ